MVKKGIKNKQPELRTSRLSGPNLMIFIIIFGLIGGIIFYISFAAPNPNLPGDLNNDNVVSQADITILAANFNTSYAGADINADSRVDFLDLSFIMSNFGKTIAGVTCSKYTSTSGSDNNGGTQGSPYRSVQKLVNSLTAGQTGCLTGGGTFSGEGQVTMSVGGTSSNPITITSDPNTARATINEILYVPVGTNNIVISNLNFNGSAVNQPNLIQLMGNNIRLTGNDINGAGQPNNGTFSPGAICVFGGRSYTYETAQTTGLEIDHNRIHNCGDAGTADRNTNQGVYINMAAAPKVHDNYIYDTAQGFGIQIWHRGVTDGDFSYNTIDHNGIASQSSSGGMIIGGDNTSDPILRNNFHNNIFSFPGSSEHTDAYGSGVPAGGGNIVQNNCYTSGANFGVGAGGNANVTFSNNKSVSDPLYTNRATKDFTLQASSPCAGYGVRASGVGGSTTDSVTSSISEGQSLSGTVHWTASVTGNVQSVEFWADGSQLSLQTAAPFSYDLNTNSYTDGAHIVGVAWTDSSGIRHPASPAINVSISNTGCNCAISSITEGSIISGTVHWIATVPVGAQSAEFWVDNTKLSTDVSSPYAYDLNTATYANGAHIVGVAWTDSSGIRHPASPAINITISN